MLSPSPFLFPLATLAGEAGAGMEALMARLMLQLAIIIIAARASGLFFQRVLRLPSVIGELLAGIVIGPYALGGIHLPGVGALFPAHSAAMPVSPELYGIATLGSILLLFFSGLETDLATFLRYSVAGTAVGIGGVIASFLLGAWSAVWFGLAASLMEPSALFLGAISTATSVGITARILSEKRKTDSPEGVTILAGAVLDDVLGIIVLTIVVGMSKASETHGRIHWGHIGLVAAKAIGFWLVCMVAGLLSAKRITRLLKYLRSTDTMAAIALGLALMLAGIMEAEGLAMIIGAYITGLALSRTDLVNAIHSALGGAYNVLVPVFFCIMGMLVDVAAIRGMVVFGLVYTILAVIAKVGGCGLAAWLMRFNLLGAYRIGAGMVPRGEVALVIAGIGLSTRIIPSDVFGVAILMTVLTSVLAPPLLARSFDNRSGLKGEVAVHPDDSIETIELGFPSEDIALFMLTRLVRAFRNEQFLVYRIGQEAEEYQIRKDDMVFTLFQENNQLMITTPARHRHVVRLLAMEELLVLQDVARSFESMKDIPAMTADLARSIFEEEDE